MSKKALALVAIVLGVISCRAAEDEGSILASAATAPLVEKTDRIPECGFEGYVELEHPNCGEIFKADRTNNCDVELRQALPDLRCPGSYAADSYQEVTTANCGQHAPAPAPCRDTYGQFELIEEKKTCRIGRDDFEEHVWRKTRRCARAQHLETCRRDDFPAQTYKLCRHKNHGRERFKRCAREEFGTVYKKCPHYKTAAELKEYIALKRESVPLIGEAMIVHRGNFHAATGDEAALYCLIKSYDQDPLFEDIVKNLKGTFLTIFGVEFANARAECPVAAVSAIETIACPDTDTSRKCNTARAYREGRKFLEATKKDVETLLNDVVSKAPTGRDLRAKLVELQRDLNRYIK